MSELETNDELVLVRLLAVLEIDDGRRDLVVKNNGGGAGREAEMRPDVALGEHLSFEDDGNEVWNAVARCIRRSRPLRSEPQGERRVRRAVVDIERAVRH